MNLFEVLSFQAQGLTLDSAFLDVGSAIFAPGMIYVALSRLQSLDGMHLLRLDPTW